jgi:hypothetical protein
MKDFLVDIVEHTQPLGLTLVKITGDDQSTVLEAHSEDKKTLLLSATFHNPNAAFAGVFGMPNLQKLKTILDIPEYKEDPEIKLNTRTENGVTKPAGIHFENKSGDFQNDYRFMGDNLVTEMVKSVKFKGPQPNWHITMEPTVSCISRLRFQASANSEESYFVARTVGTDLKFFFGDANSHAGSFVFQSAVSGVMKNNWAWPVAVLQGILVLQGDKVMQFSDDGMLKVIVDSGLIVYEYLLPAQTK